MGPWTQLFISLTRAIGWIFLNHIYQ
jgi:hypothetical protein